MQKVISVNCILWLFSPPPQRTRREEKEAAGGINYLACPPARWSGLLYGAVMERAEVSDGK